MGFCGKYCSRGRERFDFLGAADEVAQQEYSYKGADVDALKNLRGFLVNYHRNPLNWGDDMDMNMHFLFDLVRRDPDP